MQQSSTTSKNRCRDWVVEDCCMLSILLTVYLQLTHLVWIFTQPSPTQTYVFMGKIGPLRMLAKGLGLAIQAGVCQGILPGDWSHHFPGSTPAQS